MKIFAVFLTGVCIVSNGLAQDSAAPKFAPPMERGGARMAGHPTLSSTTVTFRIVFGPVATIDSMTFLERARSGAIRPILPIKAINVISKRFLSDGDVQKNEITTTLDVEPLSAPIAIQNDIFVGTIQAASGPLGAVLRVNGALAYDPSIKFDNIVIRPGAGAVLPGGIDASNDNVGILIIINN